MRIEITGTIGSGKSSLAKLLLENGYGVVFEEFKLNPFWRAFYSNPNKYNFETEVTFVLQHYHELKRKLEVESSVVCDFSFTQDLAYAVMGLNKAQLKIFKSVYNYIINEQGEPDLLVYMKCSPQEALRRITLRAREEETLITKDFLSLLNNFIKRQLKQKKNKFPILEIDTEKTDILNNSDDQQRVLEKIKNLI